MSYGALMIPAGPQYPTHSIDGLVFLQSRKIMIMAYLPPRLTPKKDDLLGLHTEWIGDSQFRITTRRVGNSTTIIVDVTELTYGRMGRANTALRLARNQARKVGAASVDTIKLCDFRADRKATVLDGSVQLVKIRQCSFSFKGVE